MEKEYSYQKDVDQFIEFIKLVIREVKGIKDTEIAMIEGRKLGRPKLGTLRLPEDGGLIQNYDTIQETDTLEDCKKSADKCFRHFLTVQEAKDEFVEKIGNNAKYMLEKMEKRQNKPIIRMRDYDRDPECKCVAREIARLGGTTTIEKLRNMMPWRRDEIESIVERITLIWKDMLYLSEDGTIIMNSFDVRSINAITDTDPITTKSTFKKIYNYVNKRDLQLLKIIKYQNVKEIRDFTDDLIQALENQSIQDYTDLIPEWDIPKLFEMKVFTGKAFAEATFSDLRFKTNMSIDTIINAKLNIALSLNWHCRNYEINIIHPSIAGNLQHSTLQGAISELKRFINKDIVTYGDILDMGEILLPSTQFNNKRMAYRIIAFIRYFTKKCKFGNSTNFIPLGPNWQFKQELRGAEKFAVRSSVSSVDQKTSIDDENTEIEKTYPVLENDKKGSQNIGTEPDSVSENIQNNIKLLTNNSQNSTKEGQNEKK